MFQLHVDAREANRMLDEASHRCHNMTSALEKSKVFLEGNIHQGFAQQRDPWGNAWLPLQDSTLSLRKRRGNSGSKILSDTGTMEQSLKTVVDTQGLTMTMDDFSGVHQEGNPANLIFNRASAPIPARRIFPTINDDVVFPDAWADQLAFYFSEMMEQAFDSSH